MVSQTNRFCYIATALDRAAEARLLQKLLAERGWEPSFSWFDKPDLRPLSDNVGYTARSLRALENRVGIYKAEALIALIPGGRGTHVEIGIALGLGRKVILHVKEGKTLNDGYQYPCAFFDDPLVTVITGRFDMILAALPK